MTAHHGPMDREIVSTRVFYAPRDAVFGGIQRPGSTGSLVGAEGIHQRVSGVRPEAGGEWRFVMRGPDGAVYRIAIDFVDVAKPERIVYQNLQPGHRFLMTMTFVEHAGSTELKWSMLFESAADYARAKSFIAEANEQNFDRLEAHLAKVV